MKDILIVPSIYAKSKYFVFYENREYEVDIKDGTIHIYVNVPYAIQLKLQEYFDIFKIHIHKDSTNQRIATPLHSFRRV